MPEAKIEVTSPRDDEVKVTISDRSDSRPMADFTMSATQAEALAQQILYHASRAALSASRSSDHE